MENSSKKTDIKNCKVKKEYDAKELFGDSNEIIIRYHEEQYRLRITKNEKLVMNK